jgi:hypothetical protein
MIISLFPSPTKQVDAILLWLFLLKLGDYEPGLVKWILQFVENATYGFFPPGITAIRKSFPIQGLREIVIPSSVTWIGTGVFMDSLSLESVTITNPKTVIAPYAFYGCLYLEQFRVPKDFSIDQVRRNAMACCDDLCQCCFPFEIDIEERDRAFLYIGHDCLCCY